MKKILLSVMFLFAAIALQAQTIIYVKPDGSGDGSSWANACDLDAIIGRDVARNVPTGAQIWVQEGTYYPSYMLTIPNSVRMFGGFSGSETQLSQRDSVSNSTIIDAQQKFGSVIRLGVSSELNGFVVQNGFAQDNPHKHGGGVFADDHSVIVNCLIINNTATLNGGGVYSKGPVEIINSTVKDNEATGSGKNTFGNCLTIVAGSGISDVVSPAEPEPPVIPPVVVAGCNSGTFDFGTVSFASATERTITGNGITQIWSDAVTATNCNKIGFEGGSSNNYRVDCRSNPSYPGDLFSWCAVARYGSTLCPNGWRVPTVQDFINLDKAMGGSGENRTNSAQLVWYTGTGANQWGGAYGGYADSRSLYFQGSYAYCWSQSENSADNGYYLRLGTGGLIYPQLNNFKYFGFSLRCIR